MTGAGGGGGSGLTTGSGGLAWSGVVVPSRAIDWSKAGLPATFPDGETTPNPWTPPTRTQCGATVTPTGDAATDATNINDAIANCGSGHYVLLGSGTFAVASDLRLHRLAMSSNGVTLRGSGPMSTKLHMTGAASIAIGAASGGGWAQLTPASSNFKAGATSAVVTGSAPSVGNLAWITQCDTGYSAVDGSFTQYPAANPCTGSHVDNGGVYVCGLDGACDTEGGGATSNPQFQLQMVLVTSVSGDGPYTVGFSPGLYMPNWSDERTATLAWQDQDYIAVGMGLEDVTVEFASGSSGAVGIDGAYASWIKGVRILGPTTAANNGGIITLSRNAHCLVANNYLYPNSPQQSDTSFTMALGFSSDSGGDGESDDLIINNLIEHGFVEGRGSDQGDVLAYNYMRDAQSAYPNNGEFLHHAGTSFNLREGNQMGQSEDDATWGTHNLNTWFRNYYSCWDAPYTAEAPNNRGIVVDSYARFENVIGNAVGSAACNGAYENGSFPYIFGVDVGGGASNLSDASGLTRASLMRWGNYDTVTGDVRWCGDSTSPGWATICNSTSEVPASLSDNAAPFSNPVPADTNLPASFFMNGMTAHPSGGTGLSWWKVCTGWSAFPTSCATDQAPPMPPIGPDVAGGPNIDGHAYDIPAALAYKSLPIDPAYQVSYTVTGSSWSGGIETLDVSGLPGDNQHTMGAFQLTGAPAACNPSGGELVMTGSSATTISYVLASNPNASCTGTMKWPDIRQFDERVYQSDP